MQPQDCNLDSRKMVIESFKKDVYQTLYTLSGFISISELRAHVDTCINKIFNSKGYAE